MTPKVSVLTPVYNVARYLPQCLDSLRAQTLEEIEFICINDGSTDESLDILRSYAHDDPRFKIIDKRNEGYGRTMNRGISAASGEYLGILESDDFVAPDAFERLYSLAKGQGDCDMVKANYFTFDGKHGERLVHNLPDDLCGRVMRPSAPENAKAVIATPAIWSALYRRAFVLENGITFLETPGAAFQDTGFVMKCHIAADKVYFTREAFVRYRVDNAGSSVKARDKVFNVCEEFHSIEGFLAERPERRPALITAVNAAKFNTYRWNKNRIDWDLRPEFLEVFAREFRAARDAGELDETLTAPERWEEFNAIAEDPRGYYERSRLADSLKRFAAKTRNVREPALAVVVPPGMPADTLARLLDSLIAQSTSSMELLLPRSLEAVTVPPDLGCSVRHIDDAGREAYVKAALAATHAPYLGIMEDPAYPAKKALKTAVRALGRSGADFAVLRMVHAEAGGTKKLNTTSFLFKAAGSYPPALDAIDSTLNDKIFRTAALRGYDGPLEAGRLYNALSFERVPKARMLTPLRDGDLLKRVSLPLRVRYHYWYWKRMR